MQDNTYSLAPITDEERMTYPVLGRLANLADIALGRVKVKPAWAVQAERKGWRVRA